MQNSSEQPIQNIIDYVFELAFENSNDIVVDDYNKIDTDYYIKNDIIKDYLYYSKLHETVWQGDFDISCNSFTEYNVVLRLPNNRYIKIPNVCCSDDYDWDDVLNFNYKRDIKEVYPYKEMVINFKPVNSKL